MPMRTKEEQREYQRQWLAQRRANFFADKSCVKCGSTERLELDHIDRETKVHHSIWSWSRDRREAEIAKCQVLCYAHHKEKTKSESVVMIHGTRTMYMHHDCRCEPCVRAASDYRQAQRRRARGSL